MRGDGTALKQRQAWIRDRQQVAKPAAAPAVSQWVSPSATLPLPKLPRCGNFRLTPCEDCLSANPACWPLGVNTPRATGAGIRRFVCPSRCWRGCIDAFARWEGENADYIQAPSQEM